MSNSQHLEDHDVRLAGRDVLSLALMDARNHTLQLICAMEPSLASVNFEVPPLPYLNTPLWVSGHIAWFQERWIARHVQSHLGVHSDPTATRLPSLLAQADLWWDEYLCPASARFELTLPNLQETKVYLLNTLENTLDLLAKTPETDDALYFYRLALLHEDRHAEVLMQMAQALGIVLPLTMPAPTQVRDALLIPGTRWAMGVPAGAGFGVDNQQPQHEVVVPAFEIDAQPVTWSQLVEFVDDGGYDREELWHSAGWDWLQALVYQEGRRAPRYVEQLSVARAGGTGAVLQTQFGQTMRRQGHQPVVHLSWWEADAWCRWAGRRLPTEVEWEVAAHTAARRGFRWGDVWEWTASSFRPYPGFVAGPDRAYSESAFGSHKVLRGGSFATSARWKSPKFRHFALPDRDDLFCGLRSCAL